MAPALLSNPRSDATALAAKRVRPLEAATAVATVVAFAPSATTIESVSHVDSIRLSSSPAKHFRNDFNHWLAEKPAGAGERSESRDEPDPEPVLRSASTEEALNALDHAVSRLVALAGSANPDAVDVASAARWLRLASAERRSVAPRVASLALVLSDALAFTPLAELQPSARDSLKLSARTLMEPFVSTSDEERVYGSLIEGGWEVTPPFDAAALAVVSADQEI